MKQNRTLTARDVAKVIPHCPSCGSDRYHSLTENGRQEFRLKTVRCEVCQFDILAASHQIAQLNHEPSSAPIWFGVLGFLIVLELLALTGLLWM